VFDAHSPSLTASIEVGALDVRHIRVFGRLVQGYPRGRRQLLTALSGSRRSVSMIMRITRTPWERLEPGP